MDRSKWQMEICLRPVHGRPVHVGILAIFEGDRSDEPCEPKCEMPGCPNEASVAKVFASESEQIERSRSTAAKAISRTIQSSASIAILAFCSVYEGHVQYDS
jgi:hypothetical protein